MHFYNQSIAILVVIIIIIVADNLGFSIHNVSPSSSSEMLDAYAICMNLTLSLAMTNCLNATITHLHRKSVDVFIFVFSKSYIIIVRPRDILESSGDF